MHNMISFQLLRVAPPLSPRRDYTNASSLFPQGPSMQILQYRSRGVEGSRGQDTRGDPVVSCWGQSGYVCAASPRHKWISSLTVSFSVRIAMGRRTLERTPDHLLSSQKYDGTSY
jgi:hypothetical protein